MGAVYDKVRLLDTAWADLKAAQQNEYKAAIAAVVQRESPYLDIEGAWKAFTASAPNLQRRTVNRAKADPQVKLIHDAIKPVIPYEYENFGFKCRVEEIDIDAGKDLVLRLRLRLFKGTTDVTPPEIRPPEYLRFVNPPVFVDDPDGEIIEAFVDEHGDTHEHRKTENPFLAVHKIVEDVLRNLVRKYGL